jgi:KaiC/GvpD/RAD55 family RecA-like ATPase
MDHSVGVPDSTTFAQRLERLKREGANLLLVGDATPEAHAAASRRLLTGAERSHRHLFVFARGADVCTSLPAAADSGAARVVSQAPGEWSDDLPETVVDDPSPDALATAVVEELNALDDESVAPGDLRICFDSITSLVQGNDSEDVFRALHLVTSRVRQVRGLGHFHLRFGRDEDYVRLLEPVFDAIVELRVTDATPEQRWYLRDSEVTSDWISL